MPAEFRVIREISEFEKIADNWNGLLSNTEARNLVTLRSEWISCTVRAYLCGYPLFIVTAWKNGTLVGAIPLYKKKVKLKKILPVTTLQFIDSDMNPRKHILVENNDANVLQGMLKEIYRYRREWNILNLKGIRRDSQLMPRLIDNSHRAKLSLHKEGLQETVYIDLNNTWEDYFGKLSKKKKQAMRTALNKMNRISEWRVRKIRSRFDFENFYPIMLEISRNSWKGKAQSDIGSVKGDELFYRAFSDIAAIRDWLRISVLEVEGKNIAFEWLVEYEDTITVFRTDFDLRFKKLSPGTCLRIEILKELFKTKLNRYDFGGAQNSYKKTWNSKSIHYDNIVVGHSGILSRLFLFLKFKQFLLCRSTGEYAMDRPTDNS